MSQQQVAWVQGQSKRRNRNTTLNDKIVWIWFLTSRQSIGKNLNQEELVLFWPLLPQRECHLGIYQLYYIFMFHTNTLYITKVLGSSGCNVSLSFLKFINSFSVSKTNIIFSCQWFWSRVTVHVHNVIL